MWELLVDIVLPIGGTIAVVATLRYKMKRRQPRRHRKAS